MWASVRGNSRPHRVCWNNRASGTFWSTRFPSLPKPKPLRRLFSNGNSKPSLSQTADEGTASISKPMCGSYRRPIKSLFPRSHLTTASYCSIYSLRHLLNYSAHSFVWHSYMDARWIMRNKLYVINYTILRRLVKAVAPLLVKVYVNYHLLISLFCYLKSYIWSSQFEKLVNNSTVKRRTKYDERT